MLLETSVSKTACGVKPGPFLLYTFSGQTDPTWKVPLLPALLIQTSTEPICESAALMRRCTLAGLLTSHSIPATHAPSPTCIAQSAICSPAHAGGVMSCTFQTRPTIALCAALICRNL